MLCKIIDRIRFEVGWYFWKFKKFFKNIFFQKNALFLGLGLFVGVYCGFGDFGVYMGLEFDIVLFVFCFGGFLNYFWV